MGAPELPPFRKIAPVCSRMEKTKDILIRFLCGMIPFRKTRRGVRSYFLRRDRLKNYRKDTDLLVEWMVTGENPGYKSLSDMEKVRYIRDWMMEHLVFGADDPYDDIAFPQAFVRNLRRERGVVCSGAAYFFTRALSACGFESCMIAGGFQESRYPDLTHAMSLVRLRHGSKTSIFVFDAYSGLEFLDPDGNFADLKTLVCALRDGHDGFSYRFSEAKCSPGNARLIKNWIAVCEPRMIDIGVKPSMFNWLLFPFMVDYGDRQLQNECRDFYKAELGMDI